MNEEIELGMRFGMCGCGSIIKGFRLRCCVRLVW